MKKFFKIFFCLFLFNFVWAEENTSETQNLKIQITEIQPFTLENEKEWFEFSFSKTEKINLFDWSISNGKTQKKFQDVFENLIWNENIKLLEKSEAKILFKISENGYFSWKKSPIGLSDSGGSIQILNPENAIVSQINFLDLKKGTKNKIEWSEIWTLDEKLGKYFPFIFSPKKNQNHSKLQKNISAPSFPEEVEILISEISAKNKKADFIEIFIKSGGSKINLKYGVLKLNRKTLWRFEDDFFVKSGDFLVFRIGEKNKLIQAQNPYIFEISEISGISTGSNSLEFLLFSDTSFEKTEDFICLKNKKLSKTELKRVEKNIQKKSWNGECIETQNMIENQSFARNLNNSDTNSSQDFFEHFNGSLGTKNISKNNPPQAVIKIQGSGKTIGNPPFSLNLTGEFSTDPDGESDLKNFIWKINGEIFSTEENPKTYKIENIGEYKIELFVEDFSKGNSIANLNIFVQAKTSGSAPKSTSLKLTEALLQDSLNFKKFSTKKENNTDNSFFAEVLQNEDFIQKILKESRKIKTPNYNLPLKKLPIPKRVLRKKYLAKRLEADKKFQSRKIIFPLEVRKRLKKNIGLIYSWREQVWPALTKELIFYEEDRQKFEYFESAYF